MRSLFRPFLTDLDSRAAVKGSRDPLGIQGLWTGLGRHVVGNLTTVSTSVRDFTTLLLGYWFAEQVAEVSGPGTELATFLKWEQLAAYTRGHVNGDWSFRGTERAKQRLSESTRVRLSADRAEQILGNQKIYGLWGLYTVPSQSSGLLNGQPSRLTPPARELLERVHWPQLARAGFRDGNAIIELLSQERVAFDFGGRHQRIAGVVGLMLNPKLKSIERQFYRKHLLEGGPDDRTEGRQLQLVDLLERHFAEGSFPWIPRAVLSLSREAALRGEAWSGLAWRLERIAVAEAVLAPVAALFIYLLGCHGVAVPEVARRIESDWGKRVASVNAAAFAQLEPELAHGETEVGRRWTTIAAALAQGDYAALIRLLMEQNRHVMQVRGNAGQWIEERGKKLDVRMQDERGQLPQRTALPDLWRHSYFVDSFFAVGTALHETTHE